MGGVPDGDSLMVMASVQLTTTLEPFGPATAIFLTDEQVDELGGGKRAPVMVTIGEQSARLRLAVMDGRNCIGISKANRAALGVEIGDTVSAVVSLDEAPREVELPPELAEALAADPEVKERFDAMASSHRKEFARWVGEAKREETRARRVAETLQMVREGKARK